MPVWGWQWRPVYACCCCSLSLSLLPLLLIAIKGSLTATTTVTTTTMLALDDMVCCWTAPLRSPFSTMCVALMSVSGKRAGAVPLVSGTCHSDPIRSSARQRQRQRGHRWVQGQYSVQYCCKHLARVCQSLCLPLQCCTAPLPLRVSVRRPRAGLTQQKASLCM